MLLVASNMRSDTWAYLLSICRYRKLSLYSHVACINVCDHTSAWNTLVKDRKLWVIPGNDRVQIRKAMGSLNMKRKNRDLYMEELKSGNMWACITLILLLLSNLETLAIEHDGQEDMNWEIAPWIPLGNFFRKLKKV